jgi:membrane-bound serine protease (ClpP class)
MIDKRSFGSFNYSFFGSHRSSPGSINNCGAARGAGRGTARLLAGALLAFILIGLWVIPLPRPGTAAAAPGAAPAATADPGAVVYLANLTGQIVPVSAQYCERVIRSAEENQANTLVIQLDTPGGDYNTTHAIVTAISNARLPVVVYVSPAGGWAGSAGTFITLSAHVAAMAPGSRIGAAHPVIAGNPIQDQSGQTPSDTTQDIHYQKITEDAAAWVRSLAQSHGRNPAAAELAVRESRSFSDSEALAENLIDLQAKDLPDLFQQLQGRTVTLSSGSQTVLLTSGARSVSVPMTGLERLLLTISDPNLAYILLIIGLAGLMVEIYHPGLILPGVAGAISMLVGLYALGTLDAYWGGILLIVLAFGLFIAEAFTFSHGALGAGGLISLVAGSLLLFSNQPYGPRISIWLIVVTAILFASLLAGLITLVVRGQRQGARTGEESLAGQTAVARTDLQPGGTVFVEGELWNAVSESGNIPRGSRVVITRVDGLQLKVRQLDNSFYGNNRF